MLAEKVGDLQQAAQKLSDVVRLYPRDEKALDTLAGVFANPQWTGADGPERAVGLYSQIARRRHEAGDVDSAVTALRPHGVTPSWQVRLLIGSTRAIKKNQFRRRQILMQLGDCLSQAWMHKVRRNLQKWHQCICSACNIGVGNAQIVGFKNMVAKKENIQIYNPDVVLSILVSVHSACAV